MPAYSENFIAGGAASFLLIAALLFFAALHVFIAVNLYRYSRQYKLSRQRDFMFIPSIFWAGLGLLLGPVIALLVSLIEAIDKH